MSSSERVSKSLLLLFLILRAESVHALWTKLNFMMHSCSAVGREHHGLGMLYGRGTLNVLFLNQH